MIGEKIFPNFWQALLIIACWATTNLIIFSFTLVLIHDHDNSILYQWIQVIFIGLNYIPYIIYLIRKTNIKIGDYFSLPDLPTLFILIIVSVLLIFVFCIPMNWPVKYFRLLLDSKIKYYGLGINIKFPALVIAFRLIVFPIAEEILYRGLILKQFLSRYNPTKAILLSSLIFGFAHLNAERFVFISILGIILGIFYFKTNSILVSSILHCIYNMALIFEFKYLDLNPSNLILYTIIFIISILTVIFLLRKPMKTVKIKSLRNME